MIKAVACRSTANPDGARCLSVSRDGVDLARGILIDYGAGRIYLYQPCDGTVLALTLERAVIKSFTADKNDRFFQRPCAREEGSTS